MENTGIFTDQEDFRKLEIENPKFYELILNFYRSEGGKTQLMEEKYHKNGKFDLLRIETEIARHRLGQVLTLPYNSTNFYLLKLEKSRSNPTLKPDPEELLNEIKDSISKLDELINAIPAHIWDRFLIVHQVDLIANPDLKNVGEKLKQLVQEIHNEENMAVTAEEKALIISKRMDEVWELYNRLTSKFADDNL